MSGSTDCSPDAAKRALLSRTSTFVSKPVPVPGGGAVDLSTLDPAALINSVAHETRFAIESAAEFNARWRAALRERFEAQGVVDELDAWLATGLSNGRPLKFEVMALKPNVLVQRRTHIRRRETPYAGLVSCARAPEHGIRADARWRPVRRGVLPNTPR